jgi:protease-4
MRELLAHVPYRGMIRERSVEPYLRLLKTLRYKRRVKGVLLDLSSGGGEAVASMDFYLAVKRLNEVKPVYVSIGSVGASGAYMTALGGRKIFAYPESDVGSIGVISAHFAARDLLRRLGVSVELLHEGVHKDAYQGYRPLTDVERAKLQAITKEGYNVFVQLVARERRRTVEEILPLATGEFWTGAQALKLGLIDGLADREGALEELARATGVSSRRTVRVTPPRPLLDRLFSGPAYSLGSSLVDRFQDAVEDAVLEGERYQLRR